MAPSPPLPAVLVADADPATIADCVQALGVRDQQIFRVRNAADLVDICRRSPPDLVVADVSFLNESLMASVAEALGGRRVPFVAVSGDGSPEALERVLALPVEAVVVRPVTPAALRAAVAVAWRRIAEREALRAEVADLRQQLADRKVIERAKGVAVRRLGVDEAEAFRRMRKLSSDRNVKLVDVAARILEAEEVFAAMEGEGRSSTGGPLQGSARRSVVGSAPVAQHDRNGPA